ncbi:MAG: hypothetical protein IJ131_09315 [Eggerthellaceae bacterium]|nr:hypothetical protein [Eggerthellaceae bacterium]
MTESSSSKHSSNAASDAVRAPRSQAEQKTVPCTPRSARPWGEMDGIFPDSLSGIVFALEGTGGATVLLNGPTGCKYYHSSLSDSQTFRMFDFDPLSFPMKWYFGQPRVPSTYLDNADYVYGAEAKLAEALDYFRDQDSIKMICIVNTPGAALIGDDLDRIAAEHLGKKPFLTVETPGYSTDICHGFETGIRALVDAAVPAEGGDKARPTLKRVNLLGMPLYLRNYTGDVAEMRRLCELCGLEVGCVLGGGSSLDDAAHIGEACLNVVMHPEYGMETARYLQERFGTPFFACDGAPVGFGATEHAFSRIAELAGGDAGPLLAESRKARMRSFSYISRLNSLTGLPKGVPFAVEGSYSELYATTSFLTDYLAMVPVALWPVYEQSDCCKTRLEELLDSLGARDTLGRDPEQCDPELVFASGSTIARLQLEERQFAGIETMLPTLGYLDVVPKTYLGVNGALQLVEMVLNGLKF